MRGMEQIGALAKSDPDGGGGSFLVCPPIYQG